MRRTVLILPPLALLAAAILHVPQAAAQFRGGGAGGMRGPQGGGEAAPPPPAALPGLQYRRAPDPIPADPNQNLAPTAALFDAINRGDLRAARDAVGRGADIDTRNVLGLTPVDAAVDQGRNDIMFFLLSVRAGSRGAPPAEATAPIAAPSGSAPRSTPGPTRPPPRGREAASRAAPEQSGPAEAIRQAPNPRLWAGDGGMAVPEVGFLGFDAGRPAGAAPPQLMTPAAPGRAPRAGRG